jgi:hypothetical protein
MIERGQDPGFPFEATHALLILGKDLGQNFQGHLAVQPGIGGPIHFAHPAGTKLGGDLVMGD